MCKKQAVAACQTALALARTVDQIRAKLSSINPAVKCLRLGWGITTGKVTMSHYGWRVTDLTLMGDCTNSAFRLSGIANKDLPSEIVICSHTAGLVLDVLQVDDLGFVSLRGRSGQEHVYGISKRDKFTESKSRVSLSYDEARVSHAADMLH